MEILKDKIVWEDPIQSDSSMVKLGTAEKLFDDSEHKFTYGNKRNADKTLALDSNGKTIPVRATVIFRHLATNKGRTVVCSDIVNKLLRTGQMTEAEALSLDVLQGKDMLDSRTNTMKPTFWLCLPATGWTKVADVKVTPFTKAIDYNKFSTL